MGADHAVGGIAVEEPHGHEDVFVLGELHAGASAESVPTGFTPTMVASTVRPLMPPLALMSSKSAWYAAS